MELATTLEGRRVQNRIRTVGINPNHWYAVAWSRDLPRGKTRPVTVWYRAIVLFRGEDDRVRALENACPHRGIELHKGIASGCNLICPYHGWEFAGDGRCVHIPYLGDRQKLPRARARSYPLRERYGLIWVFPGDPNLADTTPLPDITEYDRQDRWFAVSVTARCDAHFSICNENAMDVFHGFLHRGLQGWFDPVLTSLYEADDSVRAEYRVSYKGYLAKVLGLAKDARTVTTLPVTVQYLYPHFHTFLQDISCLYLMRLPVSETESHSFAYFFFKMPLPGWLRALLAPLLQQVLRRFVLHRFLAQDMEMMASEQRTFLAAPDRRYIEINPAILATQRLILRQFDCLQAAAPAASTTSSTRPDGHSAGDEGP